MLIYFLAVINISIAGLAGNNLITADKKFLQGKWTYKNKRYRNICINLSTDKLYGKIIENFDKDLPMLPKNIKDITEKDLQSLIDNSVMERKTLEYKSSLEINSDQEKKEFLADVSSFANASGGDLIYGIVEDEGFPSSLEGIVIQNPDETIRRLESMMRDGISPRITGINIESVNLSNSNLALIIRIPKSWQSPHRVTLKGHDKFYSRSTNGKYPLDVGELRIAFTLSETIGEKIRKFREDRISKIIANETPVPLYNNPKIILHLVPFISFNPGQRDELKKIETLRTMLFPLCNNGCDHRYNFDGYLTYYSGNKEFWSYLQFFRNGIIETVNNHLLLETPPLIPIRYENTLVNSLKEYISIFKKMNIALPVFLFLTFTGVKEYTIVINEWNGNKIERDILLLPEIVIESYEIEVEKILKPWFDAIWNACGFPGSVNYDETGKWSSKTNF